MEVLTLAIWKTPTCRRYRRRPLPRVRPPRSDHLLPPRRARTRRHRPAPRARSGSSRLRVLEPDQWCRRCGCEGSPRDTVTRLAHEPFGWRPTTLLVTIRRYRCSGCGHVWRQDTTLAAEPRSKLSRRGLQGGCGTGSAVVWVVEELHEDGYGRHDVGVDQCHRDFGRVVLGALELTHDEGQRLAERASLASPGGPRGRSDSRFLVSGVPAISPGGGRDSLRIRRFGVRIPTGAGRRSPKSASLSWGFWHLDAVGHAGVRGTGPYGAASEAISWRVRTKAATVAERERAGQATVRVAGSSPSTGR